MRLRDLFVLPMAAIVAASAACGTDAPPEQTAPAPPAAGAPAAEAPAATGEVIVVQMITTQGGASGVFEPAEITARPGDVIQFVQADGMAAHNVSWPAAGNPAGANLPRPSRYTTQAGETIDVPVTMGPGSYAFQCDPHVDTGMVGTLTVTD